MTSGRGSGEWAGHVTPVFVHVYGALLVMYPREFRDCFGGEMTATFAAALQERRGLLARVPFFAAALIDLIRSAIAERVTTVRVRRTSRVRFGAGAVEHVLKGARDQSRAAMLAAISQDVHYALRAARRAPALTAVAIVTLAAAFALTTSAFTAVSGVLFRSLPYPAPERLALISGTARGSTDALPVSFTNAMDWKHDVRAFQSLATFSCTARPIVVVRGEPSRASMMEVSADFFRTLEAKPLVGRLFDSTDFEPGASPVVVLTNALWRERFGSDPAMTSSRVLVNGVPVSVIGVLPADYWPLPTTLTCRPDLYRPLASRYDDTQRSWSFLNTIARLEPGATMQQAQAELDVVNARLANTHPTLNGGHGARVVPMQDYLTRPLRPTLAFVLVGAVLVLAIACANVASLLMARAAVRRRELSVRVALGASRWRLVRQVATECVLLGVVSTVLGVLLSVAGSGLLTRFAGDALPDPRGLTVDWRVVVFAVVASVIATSVFGLGTIGSSQGDGAWVLSALRDGGRGGTARRSRLGRMVVVAQLAIAMVVLVGAGLLARSYRRLREVQPGFDPAGVMTARLTLPEVTYPRGERQVQFFRAVLDRIAAQRDVIAVGAVSILPESQNFDHTAVKVVGRANTPGEEPTPDVYRVTPGYFGTMRIPLVTGRAFGETDDDRHPPVAIINETMAKVLFAGRAAVGQRIWTGAGNTERTIVGVVGDAYQYGLDRERTMQLYVPHADNSGSDLTLVVKSAGRPNSVTSIIRESVRAIDPGLPVDDILSMDSVLAASGSRRRLLATLSLTFAIGAIALAAIGLYGLIAYSTAQRTQEMGLRMALGASARAVVSVVVGDAVSLVVVGVTAGAAVSVFLARFMTPLLFGVAATDVATLLVAAAALLVVAILASVVPAARASSVSPVVALRAE